MMAQNNNKMTKEEYAQFKAEYKEKRKHIYDADLEVGQWVKRKSAIFKMMAIFTLVHGGLGVIGHILDATGANLGVMVLAAFGQIFWLNLFIQGNWRFSIMLYFWAFVNLVCNINMYNNYFRGYVLTILITYPISGIMFIMEATVPLIMFIIAGYLTIPKKHRQLSERADAIQKAALAAMKQGHSGYKSSGSIIEKTMEQAEEPTEGMTPAQTVETAAERSGEESATGKR